MIKKLVYVFAGIAISTFLFAAYSDGRLMPFAGFFMISAVILSGRLFKKNR